MVSDKCYGRYVLCHIYLWMSYSKWWFKFITFTRENIFRIYKYGAFLVLWRLLRCLIIFLLWKFWIFIKTLCVPSAFVLFYFIFCFSCIWKLYGKMIWNFVKMFHLMRTEPISGYFRLSPPTLLFLHMTLSVRKLNHFGDTWPFFSWQKQRFLIPLQLSLY